MIGLYLTILDKAPYSEQVTMSDQSPRDIVRYCEQFGFLKRKPHKLGDILYLEEKDAILLSYFRNNVAHLFALPSSAIFARPSVRMASVGDRPCARV